MSTVLLQPRLTPEDALYGSQRDFHSTAVGTHIAPLSSSREQFAAVLYQGEILSPARGIDAADTIGSSYKELKRIGPAL